jgi:hypothetical protein
MFGLAAIAAAALAAFAGSGTASATVLCSTTVSPCPAGQNWPVGTILDFSLVSGTSFEWREAGGEHATLETCEGVTLQSEITGAGSSSSTVKGKNKALTFSKCTWANTTSLLGGVEIHNISGTSNGTLTASEEIRWTFNTVFFGSCVYGWKAGAGIGDITEGNPAILHVNSVIERLTGSQIACPENGLLTGTLKQTQPSNTTLSVSAS